MIGLQCKSTAMKVYILQVHTGQEHQTAQQLRERTASPQWKDDPINVHALERELRIRIRGQKKLVKRPLYPGYIFIESDSSHEVLLRLIRGVATAVRYLQSNTDITPIQADEEKLFRQLMSCGSTLPRSQVRLRKHEAILVIDGPLKGMEGIIVRIDRRRERVKVRLMMSNTPFTFDMGIEIVEPNHADTKE